MLEFSLTFANIPFIANDAQVVRLPAREDPHRDSQQLPPRNQQPLADIVDEINRLIPMNYLEDYGIPSSYRGHRLDAIAQRNFVGPNPDCKILINDFYYPTTTSLWSVFRGLATSSQVKLMLSQTGGNTAQTLEMKNNPVRPFHPDGDYQSYTLRTFMYMLPPRPVGETVGMDGLYLVTLVDERYYFQGTPISLRIDQTTTWDQLIIQLASVLNISISYDPISSAYSQPEPDSQFWTNFEDASVILDAVAYNIGRVVVRKLDGTYRLDSPSNSQTTALQNRGNIQNLVRLAGGELFASGTMLPVGDLTNSKNVVIPSAINFTFPKYIVGNDPVPHFVNNRYQNQRQSAWFEDSYGDVFAVTVPVSSGGVNVSGLTGTSTNSIYDTAKALYSRESDLIPLNVSGLTSLALQSAQDFYDWQVLIALDEVYPGTFNWEPEGFHDIIWTYSARRRMASTRVMRTQWNNFVEDVQHATPAVSGGTNTPTGVGGPSVAQTWRDSYSGGMGHGPPTTSIGSLPAGQHQVFLSNPSFFPTQNRWRAKVADEIMLMEGTSGGTTVGIVYRGIDGTQEVNHGGGTLSQIVPDTHYGANLVTFEKMQFVYPGAWTSGGISEAVVVPQTQTVKTLSDQAGFNLGGFNLYPGIVNPFNPYETWVSGEAVLILERNNGQVQSGKLYDGQFLGYSATPAQPIYAVSDNLFFPSSGLSGACPPASFNVYRPVCVSGILNVLQQKITLAYVSGCAFFKGDVPTLAYTAGFCDPSVYFSQKCYPMPLPPERYTKCVSGVNNVLQRNWQLIFQSGCYISQPSSDWFLASIEGCCLCSGFTLQTSGITSTSTSTSSGCLPGVCDLCDDPPYEWIIEADNFTGTCDVFNGTWYLASISNCEWQATATFAGITITVTLTLTNGDYILIFSYGDPLNPIAFASYLGPAPTNRDCCQPVTFTSEGASGCLCSPASGGGPPPPICCKGLTQNPKSWTMLAPASDFTGCYSHLESMIGVAMVADSTAANNTLWDGSAEPINTGDLQYHAVLGFVNFDCSNAPNIIVTFSLQWQVLNNNQPPSCCVTVAAATYQTTITNLNCCSPLVLNLQDNFCVFGGNDSIPQSVTITPDCTGITKPPAPPGPPPAGQQQACSQCGTGGTPASVQLGGLPGDFTGCFNFITQFFGVNIPQTGACEYTLSEGSDNVLIDITSSPSGGIIWTITFTSGVSGTEVIYSITLNSKNCCTPVTVARDFALCSTTGNAGNTITLTPNCSTNTTCPPMIPGTPLCCSGTSHVIGTSGSINTVCCTNGTPLTVQLTITNAGACGNGTWTLVYDSGAGAWFSDFAGGIYGTCDTTGGGGSPLFVMTCEAGSAQFTLQTPQSVNFNHPVSTTCPPPIFDLVFHGVDVSNCCSGQTNASASIVG